jgi:ferredoxin/flavodoxin---NADP+ reductase
MLAPADRKYTVERICHLHHWSPKLFSFRITRPAAFRFAAGQFARLGIAGPDGKLVWRAYSMVSAPYDEFIEFFSIVVPEGEFTPHLARLSVGDAVFLDKTSFGFLTLDRFIDGRDLWMLATGTGVAPFLSMLQDPETWARFEHVVLAYSARNAEELAYTEWISGLNKHPLVGESVTKERFRFVTAVTRETLPGCLNARLTTAIGDRSLERAAGRDLSTDHSRIMVCGNPQMVEDCRKILGDKGFRLARRAAPGQLAFENYW